MELLLLATALLTSLLVLRALVHSPLARHFGDAPDHRKVHQSIVPRIGGMGIILSFLIVVGMLALLGSPYLPLPSGPYFKSILFAAAFMLVAGTVDDLRPLNFKIKFLLQFALAAGVVLILDQEFDTFAVLGHRFELGALGPLITIFFIVGVMNAFNLIDGIDGLAGGVSLCGLGAIAVMSHANGRLPTYLLCMILMGSVLGFLRFNFSRPHKMFLGDAGSQFLGTMLALMAIRVQEMGLTGRSMLVPLLIVGYPLLDVGVAMVRRFNCGRRRGLAGRFLRMFVADNEHLHHRLIYLGLSHLQSTFLLLILAGSLGATAIILSRIGWPLKGLVLAYLAMSILLILNRLGYIGLRPWLTMPRAQAEPSRIVGVIEPDEVFFHSLTSFKQDKFRFLSLPGKLTPFLREELVAVALYNASPDRFEEEWAKALRATEVQECPAVVIADARDIEKVKALNPGGFRLVHFMEKPVRIPELVRVLDGLSATAARATARPRERRFSLAEAALRKRENARL
jgi:UDP-GlcNAc:undecaprenyl-phosphate GlcNAc-1-phosphate transferase